MKKVRKLRVFLFSAVIFVSMFLCSSPVFARIRHSIRIRSSKSKSSSKSSIKLTPEQAKWAGIIVIIFFAVLFTLAIIASIASSKAKKKQNSQGRSTSSTNYKTNPNQPQDVSDEISAEIQKNDPYFNTAQFLMYAENTAVKIVMASCKDDMDVLKALESEELFSRHSALIHQKIPVTSQYDISDFSADIIKLTEYTADDTYEKISAYLQCTVFRNAYNTAINSPCNLLLTFRRPINTVSSDFGNGICPSCGTEISPKIARCTLCGSILNFNTNSWELIDFQELPY